MMVLVGSIRWCSEAGATAKTSGLKGGWAPGFRGTAAGGGERPYPPTSPLLTPSVRGVPHIFILPRESPADDPMTQPRDLAPIVSRSLKDDIEDTFGLRRQARRGGGECERHGFRRASGRRGRSQWVDGPCNSPEHQPSQTRSRAPTSTRVLLHRLCSRPGSAAVRSHLGSGP